MQGGRVGGVVMEVGVGCCRRKDEISRGAGVLSWTVTFKSTDFLARELSVGHHARQSRAENWARSLQHPLRYSAYVLERDKSIFVSSSSLLQDECLWAWRASPASGLSGDTIFAVVRPAGCADACLQLPSGPFHRAGRRSACLTSRVVPAAALVLAASLRVKRLSLNGTHSRHASARPKSRGVTPSKVLLTQANLLLGCLCLNAPLAARRPMRSWWRTRVASLQSCCCETQHAYIERIRSCVSRAFVKIHDTGMPVS